MPGAGQFLWKLRMARMGGTLEVPA